MNITSLSIPDVLLIEPEVFEDERGFFFESYKEEEFQKSVGGNISFKQDCHSKSIKGVLRGLHYQSAPKAQGKLIRAIKGEVFDVAVDIRKSSKTFGEYVTQILSAENKKQIWIPKGFAHGFFVLSDSAELLYKMTDIYSPTHERTIIWNDSFLKIPWPIKNDLKLSSKDLLGLSFGEAEVFL